VALLHERRSKQNGLPLRRVEPSAARDDVRLFMVSAGWLPLYS